MPSKKILLVRKFPNEIRVSSVAVGDTGFSWRSLSNATDLASTIKAEEFSLLFFDHRGVAGDPLAFIESVRDPKKKTPVFLTSDPLEMVSVIQAIRLGVKDYFQPPWDKKLIIDRVQSVLNAAGQGLNGNQIEKWNNFVNFLSEGEHATSDTSAAVRESGSEPDSSAALKAERENLLAERQQLEQERMLLQQALKKMETARAAGGPVAATPEVDLTRREHALAVERKTIDEKNRQVIAAQEKLEDDLMMLVQSKAKLEKEQAQKMEQVKTALAEVGVQQKKFLEDRSEFEKVQLEWDQAQAVWKTQKTKAEAGFVEREKALARLDADAQKLADGQKKLVAEQEKLETEQNLLAQAAAKQEKLRAENEAKFTQRENGLVDRALALDAQQKKQSAAEDQFLAEQEKLDGAQLIVTQGKQALEQAKIQWEKSTAAANAERAKIEAEFTAREKALAGLDAEAKKLAETRRKLSADQEKIDAAQNLHAQSEAKLAQRDKDLAQRTQALEAKQKEHSDAQKQLLAEQEKLDAAKALITQTQAKLAQETKTLEQAKAQWDKTLAAAQAEKAKGEAALQKRIRDLAEREEQIVQKEKEMAPLKAQLAAEQEKLETDQLVVKQTLAKIATERAEVAASRAKQEILQRELNEQEAAMQESEIKTRTQLAQIKKAQTQLAAEQTTLTADKTALDAETASLAERLKQFEAKQQQFKEQMKQMLSGS